MKKKFILIGLTIGLAVVLIAVGVGFGLYRYNYPPVPNLKIELTQQGSDFAHSSVTYKGQTYAYLTYDGSYYKPALEPDFRHPLGRVSKKMTVYAVKGNPNMLVTNESAWQDPNTFYQKK